MATVKTTLTLSLDEANLLLKVVVEGERARQSKGQALSTEFNNPESQLTEEEKSKLRGRWQTLGAEAMELQRLTKQLRGVGS